MLSRINNSYDLLAKGPPARPERFNALLAYFGSIPQEYVELAAEATEVEIQHRKGQYIRIWVPLGCMEMDEEYGVRRRITDAFPIGDDRGGTYYSMQTEIDERDFTTSDTASLIETMLFGLRVRWMTC